MRYTLAIISTMAFVSLVGTVVPGAAAAASHDYSASSYAAPRPPSANNYTKADDYD